MANPKSTTQVNSYDAELASLAKVASKRVAATSTDRKFISMEGALKLDGSIHKDGLPVIVLHDVLVNSYYTKGYTPGKPTAPDCYAIGEINDEGEIVGVDTWDGRTELAPHKEAKHRACDSCAQCPWNKFGTGKDQQGNPTKGKACQNTKRLAVLPVGQFVSGKAELLKKVEDLQAVQIHFVKIPVKSVKPFDAYQSVVASVMSRPLFGVVSKIDRVPDGGSFTIGWETMQKVADAWMPVIFQKVEEAKVAATFAFAAGDDEPAGKAPASAPKARKASGKSKM